jgi:hypothetical protein
MKDDTITRQRNKIAKESAKALVEVFTFTALFVMSFAVILKVLVTVLGEL